MEVVSPIQKRILCERIPIIFFLPRTNILIGAIGLS